MSLRIVEVVKSAKKAVLFASTVSICGLRRAVSPAPSLPARLLADGELPLPLIVCTMPVVVTNTLRMRLWPSSPTRRAPDKSKARPVTLEKVAEVPIPFANVELRKLPATVVTVWVLIWMRRIVRAV